MKDVTTFVNRVAHRIERLCTFIKINWKSTLVVIWMLLVTVTLIKQQQAIEEASSYTQVANLRLAVDDVRYSVKSMEEDVEIATRAITRMDNAIKDMELILNRIHTQVRHMPEG
jgi:hypothetical protein